MGEIRKMSTVEEYSLLESLSISSLDLANLMEVEHRFLIRNIDSKIEMMEQEGMADKINVYFTQSNHLDSYGRSHKSYDITRKGCDIIANKMQGTKGLMFTIAYVEMFHKMAKQSGINSIEDYKEKGSKVINNLKYKLEVSGNKVEKLEKIVTTKEKELQDLKESHDKEINTHLERIKYLFERTNELEQKLQGQVIASPVIEKTVTPVIETKEKAKGSYKANTNKREQRRLDAKALNYIYPPHDNNMTSDEHLNDDVFSLNLTKIIERNNLNINAENLNVLLESANLEKKVTKGKRNVTKLTEGKGYARIVVASANKLGETKMDLRWSGAGEKYIVRFFKANEFQLDFLKRK